MGASEYLYIAVGIIGRGIMGAVLAIVFGFVGYVIWFALKFLFAEDWPWVEQVWHYQLWIGGMAAIGGYLAWLTIRRDMVVLLLKAPEVASGLLSRGWATKLSPHSLFKPLKHDWVGRFSRKVMDNFWATMLISSLALIAVGYGGAWGGFEYQLGKELPSGYAARVTTPPIAATVFGAAVAANAFIIVFGLIQQIRNQGR